MGDEVGASFDPYSLAEPLDWRDRFGLRDHYRRLITLRHELAALRGADSEPVWRGPQATYAYVRPGRAGGHPVLLALNFSRRPAAIALDAAPALAPFTEAAALRDLLLGGLIAAPAASEPSVRVPALSARVLVPAG